MKLRIACIAACLSVIPLISSGQVIPIFLDGTSATGSATAVSNDPTYVGSDGGVGSSDPASNSFQLVPCTGVVDPLTNQGRECDFNQLIIGANRVIKFLLFLSIPFVVGMIVFMGWKYLTAGGDTVKLAEAKKMFVPVLYGIFWIFGAYLVVYTLLDKLVADNIGDIPKEDIIFLDVTNK